MELTDICRLCVTYHDPRNMTPVFCGANSLEAKITSVIHIQVNVDDGLPTSVCNVCASKLNQAFDFIEQSVAGDRLLRSRQCWVTVKEEVCEVDIKEEVLSPDVGIEEQSEPDDFLAKSPEREPSSPTPDEKVETPTQPASLPLFVDEFQCDSCSAQFPTKAILKGHITIGTGCVKAAARNTLAEKQPSDGAAQTTSKNGSRSTKTLSCDVCSKEFDSKSVLDRHLQYHRRLYGCKLCEERFTCSVYLKAHLLTHGKKRGDKCRKEADNSRPHVCGVCDMSFREVRTLNRHERRHTGFKMFKCDFCGKCFTEDRSRKKHMKGTCRAVKNSNANS